MFRELEPFLRHRAVLLTVTHLGEDQIRVNVVPKKLKDGENEALTTPLSVTGTAEELDADLPKTLVDYVGAHLQLKNSLESAKAQMDAAAKTAQEAAKAKQEEAKAKFKNAGKSGKPVDNQVASSKSADAAPSEPPKPAAPKSPSLFDFSAGAGTSHAQAPAPPAVTAQASPAATEDEILAEVDETDAVDPDEVEDQAA